MSKHPSSEYKVTLAWLNEASCKRYSDGGQYIYTVTCLTAPDTDLAIAWAVSRLLSAVPDAEIHECSCRLVNEGVPESIDI